MTTFEDELRAALHDQAQALRVPERPALDPEGVERTHAPEARRLLAVAACLGLVVAGVVALAVRQADDPEPLPPAAPVVPATTTTPLPDVLPSAFLGTWVTIDLDESTSTMVIDVSADGVVEMVVRDDAASVCSGVPSTMTGTGAIEVDELVFASPVLTCDDGSLPEVLIGPPLDDQLQNLTFVHDPGTDTLTDNSELVWAREDEPPGSAPVTAPVETDVSELLNGFIAARIAGESAQQYLEVPEADIPLLYATTSGAPYERAEFDQVPGIEWPYELTAYKVRLFAGDTVVEQLFFSSAERGGGLGYESDGYGTDIAPTTENGQPLGVPVDFYDGEVVLQAAHPWIFWDYPFGPLGRLVPEGEGVAPTTDGGQRNDWDIFMGMADPATDGAGCQTPGPANAEALAESIRSYPGLEATDPVALSVGGTEALMMDVTIAAGARMTVAVDEQGNLCERGVLNPLFDQSEMRAVFDPERPTVVIDGLFEGRATGERMRLYLFDMPEGSSMLTLAFAIVAPESRFERAVTTAAPIVASFQFNAP